MIKADTSRLGNSFVYKLNPPQINMIVNLRGQCGVFQLWPCQRRTAQRDRRLTVDETTEGRSWNKIKHIFIQEDDETTGFMN